MERMNPGPGDEEDQKEEKDERNCRACINCDRIHKTISKWMLPETARATYLERANCIPPPLFIISVSIAEVGLLYLVIFKASPLAFHLTLNLAEVMELEFTTSEFILARQVFSFIFSTLKFASG